ncbi:membrane protein [Clostridia bacterium]|nr:membrane protein [Clostridia bacterium]
MSPNATAKTGLLTAIVFVLTRYASIPFPLLANNYIHLGQVAVMLLPFILPVKNAVFAAAIGSMLADVLGVGTVHWAIPTLIIKSVMIIIIYFLAVKRAKSILGFLLAGLTMALGYYLFEAIFLTQNFAAAIPSLVVLLIEGAVSAILAIIILPLFKRSIGSI